ncbi:MAG: hypothetical protein ACLTDR_06460 [Adlercreutzia equolifaciens]
MEGPGAAPRAGRGRRGRRRPLQEAQEGPSLMARAPKLTTRPTPCASWTRRAFPTRAVLRRRAHDDRRGDCASQGRIPTPSSRRS